MISSDFNDDLMQNARFLRAYAMGLTKTKENAEDLFQDTMYRALLKRDKFALGTNLRAWTTTMMRNIFINEYRKTKRKLFVDVDPQDLGRSNGGPCTVNVGESALYMQQVERALHALPPTLKSAFQLYYEGYLYREIAQELSEPVGTIKSRIHLARRMLKPIAKRG